jgi:hypothetical protein
MGRPKRGFCVYLSLGGFGWGICWSGERAVLGSTDGLGVTAVRFNVGWRGEELEGKLAGGIFWGEGDTLGGEFALNTF